MKRQEILISHFVVYCCPEKNVYVWLLSITLRSDDHHKVVGPYSKKLNRCKCVFCNMIDAF